MKVTVVPGRELATELSAAWARIQEAEPDLASPFLRPEYTQAVASARDDVFVGVIEDAGAPVGFLPFQRGALRSALPAGSPLCEYQALVGGPADLGPRELVAGCGLVSWEFDHLLASQAAFAPFHLEVQESPVLDLTGGWEAYREAVAGAGSDLIRQGLRKSRKLEREVGPLRFEARVEEREVLRRLLEWKSAQCERTGLFDVFQFDWPNRLVETLLETNGADFAGLLSAVYAGDELVAAHFGLTSRGVWHWWFPTYDRRWARYSPGLILLLQMAQAADGLGIQRLELGRGSEPYKLRARTGSTRVARGRVECPSVITSLRRFRRGTMSAVRASPLARPVEIVARLVRRGERWFRSR